MNAEILSAIFCPEKNRTFLNMPRTGGNGHEPIV